MSRFKREKRRRAGFTLPEVGLLLRERPALPVVKYDPEFAAFQMQHSPKDARWYFQRLRQSIP